MSDTPPDSADFGFRTVPRAEKASMVRESSKASPRATT